MDSQRIIKKYLGVPYKHQGRDIRSGLDCWGLIKCIYADLGIEIKDLDTYSINWSREGENYFDENKHPEWLRVDLPHVMDVVLFKNKEGIANHAGLVLEQDRFIQCCRAGVVVSRLNDFHWYKKLAGFFRLKQK